ncbi:hypothetical protein L873DRAFT_1793016 [Choiromyces venosus 120613-1]|uniref:TPR-like protein n=1 Tax=Choiromyces venosus 120613-1 TaxID=1336337 RepID=A0A3N4JD23_9PEZI|nr:hypothetical protein L873DRAFT_1793016 [Choiromyces venosus 120613-1]
MALRRIARLELHPSSFAPHHLSHLRFPPPSSLRHLRHLGTHNSPSLLALRTRPTSKIVSTESCFHNVFRRHISASTKAYLHREGLILLRVIAYGYSFIAVAFALSFVGALIYIETFHPTPKDLPFVARYNLDLSRALIKWTENYEGAIETMRGVVSELGEDGWAKKKRGWRKGYMMSLSYLAGLEEHERMIDDAKAHYQQILQLPRENESEESLWREERVNAALRVSKICEFKNDLPGAQAALMDAVSFASVNPSNSNDENRTSNGLPPLPGPASKENTPLLLKALTELSILHARNDRQHLALELLTTILQARRAAAPVEKPTASESSKEISDPCAEAVTMAYIGELLFSMGDEQQGLAWTKEAYRKSEALAELRGACKECAIVAGRNVANMLELMKDRKAYTPSSRGGWFGLGADKTLEPDGSVEEWERSVLDLERIRHTKGK